jgi:TPR repeat protein
LTRIAAAIVLACVWSAPVAAQIYGQGHSAPGRSQDQYGRSQDQGKTPQPATDPFQEGLRAYAQRDYRNALRLWAPLAQSGHGAAQYNIGRMYVRGEGVRRDLPEAYKWFTIAISNGRAEGERARQAIARSMTPAQMAEGLRRAEEWRQRRR